MSLTKEEEEQRLRIMEMDNSPYKWLRDSATRYFGHLSVADRVLIKRYYHGSKFVIDSGGNKEEVEEVLQNVAYEASSKLLTSGNF